LATERSESARVQVVSCAIAGIGNERATMPAAAAPATPLRAERRLRGVFRFKDFVRFSAMSSSRLFGLY
jgi:hypothetical protein